MSTSRRAFLSSHSASVVYAAIVNIASAKGGGGGRGGGGKGGGGKGAGRDGAMDIGAGLVTSQVSGINPMQTRIFKIFGGKGCHRDYARLCPTKPMGRCDLESKLEQLSPRCKAFIEKRQ